MAGSAARPCFLQQIDCLIAENRTSNEKLGGKKIQLTDAENRRRSRNANAWVHNAVLVLAITFGMAAGVMIGTHDFQTRDVCILLVVTGLLAAACGGRTTLFAKSGATGGSAGTGGARTVGSSGNTGTGGNIGTNVASGGSGGIRDAGPDGNPDGRMDVVLRAEVQMADSRDAAAEPPRDIAVEDRSIPALVGSADAIRDTKAEGRIDAQDAADAPYVAETRRGLGLDAGGEARIPELQLVAGRLGGHGSGDGVGATARFYFPMAVTLDGTGGLYVAAADNYLIRKLDLATGTVSTLAGSPGQPGRSDGVGADASFVSMGSLTGDDTGHLYLTDEMVFLIRRVDVATGMVTTIADGGDKDPETGDHFVYPADVVCDHLGNLFVANKGNQTIRRIVLATGQVTTLAGSPSLAGGVDDVGPAARFEGPDTLAADGAGHLFVAEESFHSIRKIDVATGAVTTLAGAREDSGSVDGVGTEARFSHIAGLCVDGAGNLFVSDNDTIRKVVVETRTVTTLAGSPGERGSVDGSGLRARFDWLQRMACDGAGNLYVADGGNETIRKVETATGTVTTLAGLPHNLGSTDGPSAEARFDWPGVLACDRADALFVADVQNLTIRQIDMRTGLVSTLAGLVRNQGSDDGIGAAARFSILSGLVAVGGTTLYVTDNTMIRKVLLATAEVTTFAGTPWNAYDPPSDGVGAQARFTAPTAIVDDGAGNLLVADYQEIRKVEIATSTVTTMAGAYDREDMRDGVGTEARFGEIGGMALDGAGNLFVAETSNAVIRKLDLATLAVTTFAGSPGDQRSLDGVGTDARFVSLTTMAYDGVGNLFVVDRGAATIRKIVLATGAVTTVVGTPGRTGVLLGPLPARLNDPFGLAIGPGGEIYITDVGENAVLVARF
jgi:hypothetical protein